jgi:hypothetical protein
MKHPEMDGSKAESNQMFEEELTWILFNTPFKLFHKIDREGTFPNSFYKTSTTLIGKLNKVSIKKTIIH